MKYYTILLLLYIGLTSQAQMDWERVNEKWGLVDTISGKVVIPHKYIIAHDFRNGVAAVKEEERLWKLVNGKGEELATLPYDMLYTTDSGRYFFHDDSLMGILDERGKVLEQVAFDRYDEWGMSYSHGVYVLTKGGKVGIFSSREGTWLPVEYELECYCCAFNCDGPLYFSDSAEFTMKHNGKWGVISMYGQVVVPFEYEYIKESHKYYGMQQGGKFALFGPYYKPLTEFIYDAFLGRYSPGGMRADVADPFVFIEDGELVFLDIRTMKPVNEVALREYEWQVEESLTMGCKGVYGLVSRKKEFLVPMEYERIERLKCQDCTGEEQLYMVGRNGKLGVLEVGKDLVVPLSDYREIEAARVEDKHYYIINKGGKVALFTADLKQLTAFEFQLIDISRGAISGFKGGESYDISTTGEVTKEE